MTKEDFIKKWNVAFEDKEQELEFAREMMNDLNNLVPDCELDIKESLRLRVAIISPIDKDGDFLFDPKIMTGAYYITTHEGLKLANYILKSINSQAK